MIIIIYPFVLYTFSLSLSILTTKPVPLCWSSFIWMVWDINILPFCVFVLSSFILSQHDRNRKKHPHRKKNKQKAFLPKKQSGFPPLILWRYRMFIPNMGEKISVFPSGRGRADENKRYESEMDEQKSSLMAVSSSPYSYENQSILVLVFFLFHKKSISV